MTTEDNKFIPTPAQKKLLEVLLNPEYYDKSVTDICGMAKVDRTVYYDAIKKPEFVDFYNKALVEIMKGKVDDVLKATYKFATTNSKCYQDRKVLLEMAKVYEEKTKQEISGPGGGPIESKSNFDFSAIPLDQLKTVSEMLEKAKKVD